VIDLAIVVDSVVSRRRVLAAAPAVIALQSMSRLRALARQDASTPAAGEWSFTDDAGNTVTLPERPTRIVADLNAAAPLWDFGIRPMAVAGWTTTTDAAWGNVDRSTPVITASAETSEPNVEELLALGADLFVTITWGNNPEHPYQWSFPEPESYQRVKEIVPVIGISGTGSADVNTERFAELAASLGADVETPEILAAKADYEEAVAAFKTLVAEKADLTTLFVYADGKYEYVAYPPDWADLAMYQSFGLNIVVPDAEPGSYWQELSPEQAMTYQSDVLFQSTRAGVFTLEELAAHPTYGRLPAVRAGQTGPWNQDFIQSYQGLHAALENMLVVLEPAEIVTG
jgi:iron complex transport system substrate-binding protein